MIGAVFYDPPAAPSSGARCGARQASYNPISPLGSAYNVGGVLLAFGASGHLTVLLTRAFGATVFDGPVENTHNRFPYLFRHNVADTTVTLQPVGGHEAGAILRTVIAIVEKHVTVTLTPRHCPCL